MGHRGGIVALDNDAHHVERLAAQRSSRTQAASGAPDHDGLGLAIGWSCAHARRHSSISWRVRRSDHRHRALIVIGLNAGVVGRRDRRDILTVSRPIAHCRLRAYDPRAMEMMRSYAASRRPSAQAPLTASRAYLSTASDRAGSGSRRRRRERPFADQEGLAPARSSRQQY